MNLDIKLDYIDKIDPKTLVEAQTLINKYASESFLYSSSGSRFLLSDYMFFIKDKNDRAVGFITAVRDNYYLDGILSLDLCIDSEYRTSEVYISCINSMLNEAAFCIHQKTTDFIVIEQKMSHIPITVGTDIGNDTLLLDGNKERFNEQYPNGYVRLNKVVDYREILKKMRNKNGNNN